MKFKLHPKWIDEARDGYLALKASGASRDQLRDYISTRAAECGLSKKTLYAKLNLGLRTVSISPNKAVALKNKWEEIDRYARMVFDIAASKSRDEAKIDWSLTFDVLQKDKQIIPDHIRMHDVYRSITQRQNLPTLAQAVLKTTKRDHPLSLTHIDYSVSRYFKYDPRDHSLVLTPPGDGYYKDDKEDKQLRVWFAAIEDQYSRVVYAQYMLVVAESQNMTQTFMHSAFSEKNRLVGNHGEFVVEELYQGMPSCIYWDRGPGHGGKSKKKTLTEQGLRELGIDTISGGNKVDGFGKKTVHSNKGAHGVIERMNGLIKQNFESRFRVGQPKGFKISLDDLNESLRKWCLKKNTSKHPVLYDQIRWEMFEPALAGMQFPPDNFMSFFAGMYSRVVHDRMVSFNGNKYVVPEIAPNNKPIDLTEDGNNVYAVIGGKRYLLEAQEDWNRNHRDEKVLRDDDMLSERELRTRLDDDIQEISRGELQLSKMRATHQDDLTHFYEKARSVEEIRRFARLLVSERTVRSAANIITLPPRD